MSFKERTTTNAGFIYISLWPRFDKSSVKSRDRKGLSSSSLIRSCRPGLVLWPMWRRRNISLTAVKYNCYTLAKHDRKFVIGKFALWTFCGVYINSVIVFELAVLTDPHSIDEFLRSDWFQTGWSGKQLKKKVVRR